MASGVRFDGVWKKFHRGEVHDSLRDLIPALTRRMASKDARPPLDEQEFWAVRDVSFEVGTGHALGIMGMKRVDIARKFDEIIDFSEIEAFIDTPVKRYSSGMNARLGFAIAAYVDPDVLIIDEVLAVGDFRFQDKAFGRIKAMCTSGIPVVLVSHQLDRIATLCTEAILLDHGQVRLFGTASECIQEYTMGAASAPIDGEECTLAIDAIRFDAADIVRSGDRLAFSLSCRSSADFNADVTDLHLSVRSATTGTVLFSTGAVTCQMELPRGVAFDVSFDFQANLVPGLYHVQTAVWDHVRQRIVGSGPARTFTVQAGARPFGGSIQLNAEMSINRLSNDPQNHTPERPRQSPPGLLVSP